MGWFNRSKGKRKNSATPAITPTVPSGKKTQVLRALDLDQASPYYWLNGRRHMSHVPYMLPKDMQEVNRLDFQHYMLRYALRGNYWAPLQIPTRILDIGCGTGRWMLEMATTFPRASIVGLDLVAPASVDTNIAFPLTCSFKQMNVMKGLPFVNQSFDYVHQRLLVLALSADSWNFVAQECERVTRWGGWTELVEMDFLFQNRGPEITRVLHWLDQACKQRGIDAMVSHRLGHILQTAGFNNITVQTVPIPVGNWGGRLGNMAITDVYYAIITMKPLILTSTGITSEEFDHALQSAIQECEHYRSLLHFHIAYGQRLY